MPTQNTRSQIARKVNFALQLLREATELLASRRPKRRTRGSRATSVVKSATSSAYRAGSLRAAGIRAVRFQQPGIHSSHEPPALPPGTNRGESWYLPTKYRPALLGSSS